MNHFLNKALHTLSDIRLNVSFADLSKKIKTSSGSDSIQKEARHAFDKLQGRWQPAALFQWFELELDTTIRTARIVPETGPALALNFGCSFDLLQPAQKVMISAYTIGDALDQAAAEATIKGNLLQSYLIDIIGLLALEKQLIS